MRSTIFVASLLALSSCTPFSRAKAPPPPGPIPARIPDQVTSLDPAPPPKNLPPPPAIGGAIATDAKPASSAALGLPPTPKAPPPRPAPPKKTAKRTRKPTPAPPPPPAVEPAEAPAETAQPAYRLGALRTPEEKARLRRQAERMISFCDSAVTASDGRSLTAMQTEMVGRVKTFTQQAKEVLDRDPGEARNFAAKGQTFAEALLAELK